MTELETLKLLHAELTKALLERIKSGEATAADFSAAAKLLKDNSITVDPSADEKMGELEERLKRQREGRAKSNLTQEEIDEAGNVIDLMNRAQK